MAATLWVHYACRQTFWDHTYLYSYPFHIITCPPIRQYLLAIQTTSILAGYFRYYTFCCITGSHWSISAVRPYRDDPLHLDALKCDLSCLIKYFHDVRRGFSLLILILLLFTTSMRLILLLPRCFTIACNKVTRLFIVRLDNLVNLLLCFIIIPF